MYRLEGSWADFVRHRASIDEFTQATPRQKANLSHWIYRHNLDAGLLTSNCHIRYSRQAVLNEVPRDELARRALTLDYATLVEWSDRTPPATDRRFYLIREMLLQQDILLLEDEKQQNREYMDYEGFRWAAAAVAESTEWDEFWNT